MAKICMIAYTFYTRDPRVRREAEALASRGDLVDFICLQEESCPVPRDYDGVHLYPISSGRYQGESNINYLVRYASFFARSSALLARLFVRKRYDLIQVHTMPDFLVFAAAIPKMFGARVVLDVHDLMPELYECKFGAGRRPLLIKFITWMERRSIAFAHKAVAVHVPHRDALIRHGNPAEKFTVLMNVPDTRIFRVNGAVRSDQKFRLIYHGTVARRHGLEVALRAVSLARSKIPELEFLIIGAGDNLSQVKLLAQELHLDDCVRFLGAMAVEQLPHYLSEADVGLVPVLYDTFTRYMLPLKLMEYTAMGIPSIVSDTETIRAYFDSDMVRFCKPGDESELASAILELHADPAARRRLAANAARFSETYNWSKQKQEYFATIDGLLSKQN